ncbi:glycoside hydrolase family 92 protein [Endozoicomonas sp. SM1973]|uniref:Glycoside hydrolase family 92 protein n=1 Tax=Spartinivicinus marinus TaxID=2994442 RepID=A0A853I5P8_9GAMM|nr:GH92 family glycosyl hydrolase [Spartinivicinus marinus]MCX4025847.1 GH92 family glycosyl hydrolase [Spartinivicinus marinus]NYZ68663.1 glycoside hydrolase family 92 protein [Spartinivicinus marinus]
MRQKNFRNKLVGVLAFTAGLVSVSTINISHSEERRADYLIDWVDPFIGTGGHGHTYPGATMPYGMVQLSPDTRQNNWDASSGYHYTDNTIIGFSHTHLSGTGVGDYGDILLMPTAGVVQLEQGSEERPETGYRSRFEHEQESASPGYYQVKLLDYDINTELTATHRVGVHRYQYPVDKQANIILDLRHGVVSDEIIDLQLEVISPYKVKGYRKTNGWAQDQTVYFVMEFSQPVKQYGVRQGRSLLQNVNKINGKSIVAYFSFAKKTEEVKVKVGISHTSLAGAEQNLIAEMPHFDFDRAKRAAELTWENELKRIQLGKNENPANKKIFYTALYHSMLAPNVFNDVDGSYKGHDKKIHKTKDFNYYTVFSLWDTFRAEHPLLTLIDQQRTADFINTMLTMYQQGGHLPIWELAGHETGTMIGQHSIPVIVDAYIKGIKGFDSQLAYQAIKAAMDRDYRGLAQYRELGHIMAEEEGESVSITLEYAFDDWVISQMAKSMGYMEDWQLYRKRAQAFINLYDPTIGFIRPKQYTNWIEPFDPKRPTVHYTEANGWQYNFFVPHYVQLLIDKLGGDERFVSKLDEMFNTVSEIPGKDITGLIGQYAHGNEPSHHITYLYSFAGAAWKTQEKVNQILTKLYSTKPDGLSGNEDCGQMSAWYIFSALGFYPVAPGSDIYVLGTPRFNQVNLPLESGKTFTVKAKGLTADNFYIDRVELNGNHYPYSYIRHEDIVAGGELVFYMAAEPNPEFGASIGHRPKHYQSLKPLTPVPLFNSPSKNFYNSVNVAINSTEPGVKIHYTTNGEQPTQQSPVYSQPLRFTDTTVLKALAVKEGFLPSYTQSLEYIKIPYQFGVTYHTEYTPSYPANGDISLVDFQTGSTNFRHPNWQGFYNVNFDITVDLKALRKVNTVATRFLEDSRSWIFLPKNVTYAISTDGESFKQVKNIPYETPSSFRPAEVFTPTVKLADEEAFQYIRITGEIIGNCPDWHPGAGKPSFIFADEVVFDLVE